MKDTEQPYLENYLQGKGVFITLTDKIPQQKNMSL